MPPLPFLKHLVFSPEEVISVVIVVLALMSQTGLAKDAFQSPPYFSTFWGYCIKCSNMWRVLQDELSPLVKQLLPLDCRDAPNVP